MHYCATVRFVQAPTVSSSVRDGRVMSVAERPPGNWASKFGSVARAEVQCDGIDVPKSRSSAS